MPPETLATLAITPDDVAQTFMITQRGGEDSTWERYQRAVDWYLRGLAIPDAAAEEGISFKDDEREYRRFADMYRGWLPREKGGHGDMPYPAQAVRDLHELGIFPGQDGYEYIPEEGLLVDHLEPFTATNPRFAAVSMLSSLRFLGGATHQRTADSSTMSGFFSGKEMKDSRILDFLQALSECPDHQVGPEERKIYIDALQARFMFLLNNAVGHHADTEILVPRIISASLETLRKKKIPEDEQTLAKKVLTDFGLAFFGLGKARVQPRYVTHARGQTLSLLNRDHAIERAKLMIEIMGHADLGAEVKSFGPYEKETRRGPGFYSVLDFGFEGEASTEIDLLKQLFFSRIQELTTSLQQKTAP